MTEPTSVNGNTTQEAEKHTQGEIAVIRFREILAKGDTIPEDQLAEFGWKIPLVISSDPSPYCIPQDIFTFKPEEHDVFKIFFKGTAKEVRIRQIFMHTQLSEEDQRWLTEFREHCEKSDWKIPLFMEPMVLRIIWLAYRKWGDNIITRSFDLAKMMVEWRQGFFPLNDQEPELKAMLDSGVMYWVGRDQSLRPLLLIKLSRLAKGANPEVFKRLTIFCFEWGLRYLIIPGLVETVTVLLDVRGVALHQLPVSALTDMTNTLTKQYPFRLNRMLIINDSFFVQTVWNIAKQFLTEVQQQKMLFFRTGYEEELMKEYTPWQLETIYGGTRPEITSFYPFPIAPGPYTVGSKERPDSYKNAYRATDRVTSLGVLWEKECRMPIQWAPGAVEVFKDLSLPLPEGLEPEPTATDGDGKESSAVQDESSELRAAEAAAADAKAVADAAAADAQAAAEAAEAAVKEAEAAEAVSREAQAKAAQDEAETKRVDGQETNGEVASPVLASGGEGDVQKKESEEQPKKLPTVDGATAPEKTEPEAQTTEPNNKISDEKTQSAVAKVGGRKCCSRCSIQ